MSVEHPPCGLYRTTQAICEHVATDMLVYYHNHGESGPAVFLPEKWQLNRAQFTKNGHTVPTNEMAQTLEPLQAEGFYMVTESFFCCQKLCKEYVPDELVQLGYNRAATPIIFTPELVNGAVAIPEQGTKVDSENLGKLHRLKIRESRSDSHQ